MPLPIDPWKVALEQLSGHNQSLRAPDGVDRGYALPPASLFVNTQNQSIAATLFRNWLKLRRVFIYRLSSSARRFSKKQWRQMLSPDEAKEARLDTRTGQHRLGMHNLLKEMVEETSIRLQFNDLASAPVEWEGQKLDGCQVPAEPIAKGILWELSELNFRQDFVMLDCHVDDSGMSKDNRSLALEACWDGTRDLAPLSLKFLAVQPPFLFACPSLLVLYHVIPHKIVSSQPG
ncbi:hypothetical protein K435DRAFT_823420 [Dendrothele bispora CBS 962.96]|uniref:Uncharacterized protein n=1 Tax=Dendrothele bispora (strain CBS 962.96) TaxID=1314807 RepID=A0A4S8KZG4_DENBC|nr:hypothetical protein K435DRAFT_823420 [Dendrothele bispora CBS 962.96]